MIYYIDYYYNHNYVLLTKNSYGLKTIFENKPRNQLPSKGGIIDD